jgi:uncharacterized protein (TIGR03437 family)
MVGSHVSWPSFLRHWIRVSCLLPLIWPGGGSAAVAAEVSLPHSAAAPGSSLLLPVSFAAQGDSVSGIQFDLQYDTSVMSISVTVSDASRASGKSLYIANPAPNQIRFVIVGLNRRLIPDGTLCTLFVNLNGNAPDGAYPLKFSQVSRTNPQSESATVQSDDGAVTIQNTVSQRTQLQVNGVLSAASLLPGPIAPGELITLLGAGIGPSEAVISQGDASLDNTAVLFDGTAAPLLYAGPNQINAVVPYGISGKSTTQLEITYQQQTIAALSFPVATAVPAIFTQDSSGIGPGAILNQDYTLNTPSNPAARGSIVMLFATGAGQTDPPGTDAQPAGTILPKPLLPVSVQIAGLDAPVVYAGAAPGLIAGMLQVNCLIPEGAPDGFTVPVVITVGSASSQTGATLAIH